MTIRPRQLLPAGLLLLSAAITLPAPTVSAQARPGSQTGIDLDRALQQPQPQDRARSYYHFALSRWHQEQGDLGKALSEVRSALLYDALSSELHVALASLLFQAGDLREGVAMAEEAARLDPKNPEPRWLLANVYLSPSGRTRQVSREDLLKAAGELEEMKKAAPGDERAYYRLGEVYFKLKEPEKAIAAFEKFQELVPNIDAGYQAIAGYYESIGNEEKKIEYLLKAVDRRPTSAENLVNLANAYAGMHKNEEAIRLYRKALEQSGDNPLIKRQLAAILIDEGEFDEALQVIESVAEQEPGDYPTQILLGRAQVGARQFLKGIETLKAAAASSRAPVEAEFYLGIAYEQSGDFQEAVRVFTRLVENARNGSAEHRANLPVFQQHLAAAYQDLGEFKQAIAIYEEMMKGEAAGNPRMAFYLVNAYRVDRQYDKALALGRQQYERNPDDTGMALVYSRALADAGKAKEGAEILLRRLKDDPANVDLYVNLSQIYVQGKRFADAEKILLRAEEKKLDSERIKFQLGSVYERQKHFDKAERLFKEVLLQNPRNANALNYIGYMLADRGIRLQEAVDYVREALELEPNNGAYLDSLGWAYFKLNELEKAEEFLLRAVEFVRNDPVILDHLGDLYFQMGDYAKAENYWKLSLDYGTEQEEIRRTQQKLRKLKDAPRKKNRL